MASPPRPNDIPSDRLSAGIDQDEYFDLADTPGEIVITDTDDGGAFVEMPGEREESTPPDEGFYSNLAAVLPDREKDRICTDLIRMIEIDKEARKKRDEQYEEGIRRTGMGNDAPGGAEFEGASRVVHPMMTEACIDYQSRIMKEIFPPSGPVRPSILGTVTKAKTARAQRITDHMNYQIVNKIRGARATLETLFAQVPLGGSQYIRQYWDHGLKQPAWQFASVDKVLIPFSAADFASAKRRTFMDTIDKIEFQKRVEQGMYLDLKLGPPAAMPEMTKAEAASHKVEGLDDPGENLDGDRAIYETMTWLEVTEGIAEAVQEDGREAPEKEGELLPYLITIDQNTRKMFGMYRAWEEKDPDHEPIEHLFEFMFVPWRGPYGIGFPQIIGGLSAAATGALRGLLDSAHVNNIPSGLVLKGSGIGGQNKMPNPGELVEVDAGLEADDVRKRVMPMPFNPPSTVLFQLLGFLIDAAKGVVRTSMDETPMNTAANVPVGTQISRVEEGLTVFTAIHGRAHASFNQLLKGLHRLNRLYLPEELKVDAQGKEILVRRADYDGPCMVQPVSDPTIYSDLQRFNQLNYIEQRALVNPQLWDQYQIELAGLKLIKWPDPETLLRKIPTPHEANAVNENLMMCLGQPVQVYAGQDHLAHLQVVLDFMKTPALGGNPMFSPIFLPAALKHSMDHIAYFYAEHVEQTVSAAAQMPINALSSDDPEIKRQFDRLLATGSTAAIQDISNALAGALPVLQAATQQVQAMMPKPPMDPSAAAVQAAAAETARKTQADQAGTQLDTAKLQSDQALKQQELAIKAAAIGAKQDGDKLNAAVKVQTSAADNETALEISEKRAQTGSPSHYTNGQSMTR